MRPAPALGGPLKVGEQATPFVRVLLGDAGGWVPWGGEVAK